MYNVKKRLNKDNGNVCEIDCLNQVADSCSHHVIDQSLTLGYLTCPAPNKSTSSVTTSKILNFKIASKSDHLKKKLPNNGFLIFPNVKFLSPNYTGPNPRTSNIQSWTSDRFRVQHLQVRKRILWRSWSQKYPSVKDLVLALRDRQMLEFNEAHFMCR